MLVMVQDNSKERDEQFRLKNNMGARKKKKKKKQASINIEIVKTLEKNPSINGGGKRSKWIEYKV